jgi:pimeloyl-ACP methyl ester carboxylesterase
MPTIQIADFLMQYEDQGAGIPLLLIHGFPLNRTLWQPQIDSLPEIARVLAPDLRGHGLSDPVPGPYAMDRLAEDCLELMDKLGLGSQPVVVGGLSMGGYVAFALYRRAPQRVRALILAATRSGADSPEGKANRAKQANLALEQGVPAVVAAALPKLLSPTTFETKPDLVEAARDLMETTSVEGVVGAQLGMQTRPDSTALLASIDKPVLILHGADDQLIPLKEAEAMQATIPNARLIVLPEAGHLLKLEQPLLFNAAVREFLTAL